MGRPRGSTSWPLLIVTDFPPGCPGCGSTARYALRVLRRDPLTDGRRLVRRRVQCHDCGCRYTLLTTEQPPNPKTGQN